MARLKQVWKVALEYAVVVIVMTAAYPFIKGNGLFDQWFGLWWLLTFLGLPALIVLSFEAYRRYRGTER